MIINATTSMTLSTIASYKASWDRVLGVLYITLGLLALFTNGRLFHKLFKRRKNTKAHAYMLLVWALNITDLSVGIFIAIPLGKCLKTISIREPREIIYSRCYKTRI